MVPTSWELRELKEIIHKALNTMPGTESTVVVLVVRVVLVVAVMVKSKLQCTFRY